MKNKYIAFIGIGLLALTGCGNNPGPDYGMDFSTPEFFLARMNSDYTRLSISTMDYQIEDFKLEVRDALFENDDFSYCDDFKPTSNEYFSYYSLLEENAVGEHYAELIIYKDGYLKIDYKEPAFKKTSFYFTMPQEASTKLFNLVDAKIKNAFDIEEEARNRAKGFANFEGFIDVMRNSGRVKTDVLVDKEWKSFNDSGALLEKIATSEHTLLDYSECKNSKLIYNSPKSGEANWTYNLDSKANKASIRYDFKDKLGRNLTQWFTYSLSKTSYNDIYTLAKSLIK